MQKSAVGRCFGFDGSVIKNLGKNDAEQYVNGNFILLIFR